MQATADPDGERDALWIGLFGALVLSMGAAPDVGYGDAGELGTAAVVLGVAHPTGFAVDLLWLKAASFVPLGPLAFRLNVGTALAGGAALGLCAAVIGALASRAGVRDVLARRAGVALGVSGLYGLSIFAAATRAVEVYALALCAVLFAVHAAVTGGRRERAATVLVGLALGLHVTAGLYAAPVLLACALRAPRLGRWVATRAPLVLAGALVLAYLPLASRRDPAIDWGDPETFSGVLAHLSAQRIRSAYREELFGGNESAPAALVSQLGGLSGLLAVAFAAALLALWRARSAPAAPSDATPVRRVVLGIALLGSADLAYALLINPMGVRDLQCGHVAGACLAILGGLAGAMLLAAAAERRFVRLGLTSATAALTVAQLAPTALRADAGGYALGELFGSGGLIATLPPRTVFLCTSDNACAASMFALSAERVRPDMDSAPAQHLWDATVLRQLEGVALVPAASEAERGSRALENARALIAGAPPRPIALEARKIAGDAAKRTLLAPLGDSAFLSPASAVAADAFSPSLHRLERALRSRFRASPSGPLPMDTTLDHDRARFEWSRVFGELGAAAVHTPAIRDGLAALDRATQIAPQRAVAWTNLGVGLEKAGRLDAAVEVTQRAVALEPTRATGWVNLARLERARGNRAGARAVLAAAAHAGVEDARLEALARELTAE